MLWFFHIFKTNMCHGIEFHYVLFIFDAIFEFAYTVFPLALVGFSYDFMTLVGVIETENTLSQCLFVKFNY